jgi:hypothetical protein
MLDTVDVGCPPPFAHVAGGVGLGGEERRSATGSVTLRAVTARSLALPTTPPQMWFSSGPS